MFRSLLLSWFKLVANVNQLLSLIESIVAVVGTALSIVCDANTCHTHALSTNLVVPGPTEMPIVCFSLTTPGEDKTVVSWVGVLGLLNDTMALEVWLIITKAAVLILERVGIARRISILVEKLLHLCLHHLHLNVHPLHLAIIILAQT